MNLDYGESTLMLPGSENWLARYEHALKRSGVSEISRIAIIDDAKHIALAAQHDPETDTDSSRVRTGVVMGAVQSGKTASMLGVAAHSLDLGVNVLVVLAGTRTTLWLQTLSRVRAQLDVGAEPVKRRVLLPAIDTDAADHVRPSPRDLYQLTPTKVRRALSKRRPIVFVAMKQVDHLAAVAKALHETVYPQAATLGLPVRLLVVDDEADDSSVSGDVSASAALSIGQMKQVPRLILDLWEDRHRSGQTAADHVFATYVGYTATPQANFLQDPQNPLAPRHFVASLRTPGERGALHPRSLTYADPSGINGWYTGSEIFYETLADHLLVVSPDEEASPSAIDAADATAEPNVEDLANAIRAYLVAAAIRRLRSPEKLGPFSARGQTFASADEAAAAVVAPTSMLIHPSSAKQDHFAVADAVRAWWHGAGGEGSHAGVLNDLDVNESAWQHWLRSYERSERALAERLATPGDNGRLVPAWESVAEAIFNEIVPATRIAVVNSDPAADERPRFVPSREDDAWHAAHDLSSIFVSGNVMARGLTLEGLLTTLFTREAAAPLADTQMQMQRWFGYRGSYIELCRVFLSEKQRDLFVAYAAADVALRTQVLTAMGVSEELSDFAVLQGRSFSATGKISGLRSLPLSPGRRPFIRFLNPAQKDDPNLRVVAEHFMGAAARGELLVSRRGLIDRDSISLEQAADLLDSLRYVGHGFSASEERRWQAYADLARVDAWDHRCPLYRAPRIEDPSVDLGSLSPYSIAAYLRFWSVALERRVLGLFTDELPPRRWSLLDLDVKIAQQPRFRVGLRFGSGSEVTVGPLAPLRAATEIPLRSMARDVQGGILAASWGSRGATEDGYWGDDLFDYNLGIGSPDLHPDGSRRAGSDALILFHLVEQQDGRGAIAVGLSLPSGGPEVVQAATPHTKGQ